jgi:hypothetical protein
VRHKQSVIKHYLAATIDYLLLRKCEFRDNQAPTHTGIPGKIAGFAICRIENRDMSRNSPWPVATLRHCHTGDLVYMIM